MRWIIFLALTLGLGCTSSRRETPPTPVPQAPSLAGIQVKSTMGEFAGELGKLDNLLRDRSEHSAEEQKAILMALQKMDRLAGLLQQQNIQQHHPRLVAFLPQLRSDIEQAHIEAAATPPNYYRVANIMGSCMYCHPMQ